MFGEITFDVILNSVLNLPTLYDDENSIGGRNKQMNSLVWIESELSKCQMNNNR